MAATKKGTASRALKVRAFVEAYVGPAGFVARDAARMAGYTGSDSQLRVRGSEFLADPAVGALIKERITAKIRAPYRTMTLSSTLIAFGLSSGSLRLS